MIKHEDDCVGCQSEIGCLGSGCKYKNAAHYYCDCCGEEEQLYEFDNMELCIDCIEKKLIKVNEDE